MDAPLPWQAPWFIVGLPGSGKSRLGERLGELLCVPHIDTDRLVEENAGKPVTDIFRDGGESLFRSLEADAVRNCLGSPGVVSLGGGAVETAAVREALSGQHVIWVDAEHSELLRRVRRNSNRPLLKEDPSRALHELRKRREPLFSQVATVTAWSTNAPLDTVVDQVLAASLGWNVTWVAGEHKYPVITGVGTRAALTSQVPNGATRCLIVTSESLCNAAEDVRDGLAKSGLQTSLFVHEDGERAKDLGTASRGWDALAQAGIGRKDLVVSVGGGVTTDLAGFLAATWLRGVKVVHLPTSLLAMVDAAIGGKTGINTRAGKNLVGAFHDPTAVLIDVDYLSTLPEEEYVAGLAEAVKTGFIRDPAILRIVEENPRLGQVTWATGPGLVELTELVRRSVAVKAAVVSEDRLEGGLREILNYGHTFGHAVERAEDYEVRHGEAVAIGSVFAAELAQRLGLANSDFVTRQRETLRALGLPVSYKGDLETLLEGMRSDKKVRGGQMRFVLLPEQGNPEVHVVDEAVVASLAADLYSDQEADL